MDGLIMAGQLLLALAILVTVHEWGHFITARMFGVRVERFYLFFDFLFPFHDKLNFALWKKKIGDTEYGIGWFPLGGYVKIAGMMDESMDKEALAQPAKPDEFRSKPAWQRLIVMLGGVIVNVILGILIFIGITYYYGETDISAKEMNKYGIVANDVAKSIGLRTGDKIIEVNGKKPEFFAKDVLSSDVLLQSNSYYKVLRKDSTITIPIPNNLIEVLSDGKTSYIDIATPFNIIGVEKGMGAEKAGLLVNDKILSINGKTFDYFHEFQELVKSNKGKKISVAILRNQKKDSLIIGVSEEGKIGIATQPLLERTHVSYSLAQSAPIGANRAFEVVAQNIMGFKKIFKGDAKLSKSVSGPLGIAKAFGGNWIWGKFWMLTGMLSMVLAFMNLLPIPALDGGHALFLIIEIIQGKPLSEKVLEIAQGVGMYLILLLMVFVFGNDILKIFQ